MIIYKATCLETNKIYIGKTVGELKNRKRLHFTDAKRQKMKTVFHKALLKYGGDAFVWEVLDTVMFSDLLLDLEKFYIAKYNCMIPNGYNMTAGGEGVGGYKHSEESKKKMSAAHIGRKPWNFGISTPEEIRKKQSVAAKSKPPIKEETRKKLSLANSGKPWSTARRDAENRRAQESVN